MMKKTRRFVSLLLACVMAIGMLAGCGSQNVETTEAQTTEAQTTEAQTTEAPKVYPAGVYTGTAQGMKGELTVEVTVNEKGIEAVKVVSHSDTAHVAEAAINEVTARIVEHQSVNVDVATGATMSSFAIRNAVSAALESAGIDVSDFEKAPEEVEKKALPEESYDIVIVGAGGAGLTAGMQAARTSDYSVLILEKQSYVSGSTGFSGGGIAVTNTEFNTQANFTGEEVADYFDRIISDYSWAEDGIYVPEGETINKELIARTFNNASLFDYLYEEGFPVGPAYLIGRFGEEGKGITLSMGGAGGASERFAYWLRDLAERQGAEIRVNSEVVDLVVTDGAVTGVIVETDEGTYQVNAKKVILAMGGYTANKELVNQNNSVYENIDTAWAYCNPGNVGDVFTLLEDLDAAYVGYGLNTGIGPHYPYYIMHYPMFSYVNNNGYCYVDQSGKLINDPTTLKYQWALDIMNAEGGMAYALVADNEENFYYGYDFENVYGMTYEAYMGNLVDQGFAYRAETLEEMATMMGMNIDSLKAAVAAVNAVGGTMSWTGTPIDPVGEDGPYYLVKATMAMIGTMKGVKLNTQFQVLNNSGEAIPNLYAAGEVAMGNYQTGRYVTSGTAVAIAVYGGALAADEAVAAIGK